MSNPQCQNARERIVRALSHQDIHPIPYQVDLTAQQEARMVAHTHDAQFAKRMNNCMACAFHGTFEDVSGKPGFVRDHFGVVWNRTGADRDIGVIDHALIADIENHNFVLPEIDESALRRTLAQGQRRAQAEGLFFLAGIGFSLFERAWTLLGMEDCLCAMAAAPEALDALMQEICAYNERVLSIMLEYPVDGIYFGDDWGQQKGLIMGAAHWRRFVKPYAARLYHMAHEAGKWVFQHSCGDISEILPELCDIGLNCYQTFQPEIYDIAKVKQELGSRLTFWGAISTQRLLPFATPEQVFEETNRILALLGRGGGYIAAPTHAVPGDVPPENLLAMLRAFDNQ